MWGRHFLRRDRRDYEIAEIPLAGSRTSVVASRRCAACCRGDAGASRPAPAARTLLCDLITSAISAHKAVCKTAQTVPVARASRRSTVCVTTKWPGSISRIFGVMLACPLAHTRFAGSAPIAVACPVPLLLLFIPLADIITRLRLSDTLASVMLTYGMLPTPFCAWLLTEYFRSVPRKLEGAVCPKT